MVNNDPFSGIVCNRQNDTLIPYKLIADKKKKSLEYHKNINQYGKISRLSFFISPQMHRRAKMKAIEKNIPLNDFIKRCIQSNLNDD